MRRGVQVLGFVLSLSLFPAPPASGEGGLQEARAGAGRSARDIPAVRRGEVALSTGVRVEYAEAGRPGGEPVLFLHGYTDSWFSWAAVLERLPDSIHGLAPSQRGHGDSERPGCCYAVEDFVADAVAFLDAVGVDEATVVGHSMGSFIAQRVAIDHPRRVRRLVLVGSYTHAANNVVLDLAELVETLEDPVPEAFVRDFQRSTLHGPVPDPFLETVVSESRKLPARVWRDALAGMLAADNRQDLSRIQVPTLILWGVRDLIFDRAEQELLWASIPQATLRLYSDTGHGLHWERPEPFVRHLAAFLE